MSPLQLWLEISIYPNSRNLLQARNIFRPAQFWYKPSFDLHSSGTDWDHLLTYTVLAQSFDLHSSGTVQDHLLTYTEIKITARSLYESWSQVYRVLPSFSYFALGGMSPPDLSKQEVTYHLSLVTVIPPPPRVPPPPPLPPPPFPRMLPINNLLEINNREDLSLTQRYNRVFCDYELNDDPYFRVTIDCN
jgi:hypothetical protein